LSPCGRHSHENSLTATRCSANPIAACAALPNRPRGCRRSLPLPAPAPAPRGRTADGDAMRGSVSRPPHYRSHATREAEGIPRIPAWSVRSYGSHEEAIASSVEDGYPKRVVRHSLCGGQCRLREEGVMCRIALCSGILIVLLFESAQAQRPTDSATVQDSA